MKKRISSAILMIIVVVGFLLLRYFVNYKLFNILLGIICLLGTFEMIRAFETRISVTQKMMLLLYSTAIAPLYTVWGYFSSIILFLFFVAAVISLMVFDYDRTTIESVGLTIFGGLYPALGLVAMLMINDLSSFGLDEYVAFFAVFLTFSIAPMADLFAMVVGRIVKGPKLSPVISPNKTIAGFIGSFFGGILAVLAFYWIMMPDLTIDYPYLFLVLLGIVGSAAATFGDLVESVIKRRFGLKDMGKLLPGHGGVLDRIDSMLFTSIVIFIAFYVITLL